MSAVENYVGIKVHEKYHGKSLFAWAVAESRQDLARLKAGTYIEVREDCRLIRPQSSHPNAAMKVIPLTRLRLMCGLENTRVREISANGACQVQLSPLRIEIKPVASCLTFFF